MAPLPVISGTYRLSFDWSPDNGIAARNVLHVQSTSESESAVIDAFSEAMDGVTGTGGGDRLFIGQPTSQALEQMTAIKLDGSSAAVTKALTHFRFGTSSVEDVIMEACAVISLQTGLRGPANRGRVFLGPLSESAQNAGFLTSATRSGYQDAWEQLLENLISGSPSLSLVVASYRHATAHTVLSVRCDAEVGMQRKRLLRTRT